MRFVFITGAGRCGTTLMRGLLDGHSAYHVLPGEASGFHKFFLEESGWASRIRLDKDAQRLLRLFASFFEGCPDEAAIVKCLSAPSQPQFVNAQEFLEYVVNAVFPDSRDCVVVDVTSEDVSGLLSEFPDSRVIHMLRHPMEQLNSHYRFRFRDPNSFGGTFPGNWELGATFRRIYRSFSEAATHRDNPRLLAVRLEDLQKDPALSLDRIVRFMGFEPEAINLSITQQGVSFDAGSTQKSSREVFRSDSDRTCLTANDLYHLGMIAAARDWYDVPELPPCENAFLPFLVRQLGLTGRNRPRLRLARLPKVLVVTIAQYLSDLSAKHYFRLYLEQNKPFPTLGGLG